MGEFIRYLQRLTPVNLIDPNIMYIINNLPISSIVEKTLATAYVSSTNYNFVYVPWKQGAISIGECRGNQDILSTNFSGCYLARVVGVGNRCCCYHIHRGSNGSYKDQKDNWNAYIGSLDFLGTIQSVSVFRPDRSYHPSIVANDRQALWGLIAHNGDCYSAIVERSDYNPKNHRLLSIVYQERNQQLTIP